MSPINTYDLDSINAQSSSAKPAKAEVILGTFLAPSLLKSGASAGVVGDGSLHMSPKGVRIEAALEKIGASHIMGLVGLLVGAVAGAVLVTVIGIGEGLGIIFAVGGFAGGIALGRKLSGRKPLTLEVPWHEIQKGLVTTDTEVVSTQLRAGRRNQFQANTLDKEHLRFELRQGNVKGVVIFIPNDATSLAMQWLDQCFRTKALRERAWMDSICRGRHGSNKEVDR